MRILEDHMLGPSTVNDLAIHVTDQPGHGGACHNYEIKNGRDLLADIKFQNGPIQENGVNGITGEALLTVLMDRLRSFQRGEYSCKENACALTHLEEALHWMQQRTISRMRRGVEGTSVK